MFSAEEATLELLKTDLICSLLNMKPEGIDWLFSKGFAGGVTACALADAVAVGVAIIAPEDKSLSVVIAAAHRGKGLGVLVSNKAIILAASKGFKELTARVRPHSGGARLAARLGFVEVRADAFERYLRLEIGDEAP